MASAWYYTFYGNVRPKKARNDRRLTKTVGILDL